jgi:hypothetical protein
MLDEYLQQHCVPMLHDIGPVHVEVVTVSAQHSNSSSTVVSRLDGADATSESAALGPASNTTAACPISSCTPRQESRTTPRPSGIGWFSLSSNYEIMQGLQIQHISVEFSHAGNSNTGSIGSAAASSTTTTAAASALAAQPVPAPNTGGGTNHLALVNLQTLVDEAGASLTALDSILGCIETLAQAILLR